MVCDTSASKDVSKQQIWDSHLKYYKRYVLDTIILQTRSEVKVTQKWYVILRHQKLHPHTKFGILTFNNIRNAPDTTFLKTRSEVKVTVTHKMVQDTPPSQDAFIHQNWDSYLK